MKVLANRLPEATPVPLAPGVRQNVVSQREVCRALPTTTLHLNVLPKHRQPLSISTVYSHHVLELELVPRGWNQWSTRPTSVRPTIVPQHGPEPATTQRVRAPAYRLWSQSGAGTIHRLSKRSTAIKLPGPSTATTTDRIPSSSAELLPESSAAASTAILYGAIALATSFAAAEDWTDIFSNSPIIPVCPSGAAYAVEYLQGQC